MLVVDTKPFAPYVELNASSSERRLKFAIPQSKAPLKSWVSNRIDGWQVVVPPRYDEIAFRPHRMNEGADVVPVKVKLRLTSHSLSMLRILDLPQPSFVRLDGSKR